MEDLKPLASLTEPDERQLHFAVSTGPVTFRPRTLEDVYGEASHASLHLGVPEAVRSHFAMAQNLVAYSWFFYPFNVAAELHAYTSIEFALKMRYPGLANKSLQHLVAQAQSDGLLGSHGFTYGKNADEAPYPPNMLETETERAMGDYAAEVAKAFRLLRNSLAHGTPKLHMKGGAVLLACAEFINQLFPVPQ